MVCRMLSIAAPGATPASREAIRPATTVPWPSQSSRGAGSSGETKSDPGMTSASWGCGVTPVSMTATVTPRPERLLAGAVGGAVGPGAGTPPTHPSRVCSAGAAAISAANSTPTSPRRHQDGDIIPAP